MKTLIANWKMYGSIAMVYEHMSFFHMQKAHNLVLALPTIYLSYAHSLNIQIKIAAQTISQEQNYGAYTGEVNAKMLKDCDVKYCIVGHSERRQLYAENELMLNNQLNSLLASGISPIVCVGESLEMKHNNLTNKHIAQQLSYLKNKEGIIIAYEPIWAIGTNQIPSISEIEQTICYIKSIMPTKVLYGGSVNELNSKQILGIDCLDGLLIGKVSLNKERILEIYKQILQID